MKKLLSIFTLLMVLLASSCLDPCRKTNCINGGTCIDGTCNCLDGYEGKNCEVESREKFIGVYAGLLITEGEKPYDSVIKISKGNKINELKFGFFSTSQITIEFINSQDFNIPEQDINKTSTIKGLGSFKDNKLEMTLYIKEEGISKVEKYDFKNGIKQK